jgi:hypothetical protein
MVCFPFSSSDREAAGHRRGCRDRPYAPICLGSQICEEDRVHQPKKGKMSMGGADSFAGLKQVVSDWPDLGANTLPQNERRAANEIQQSLRELSSYASDFGAAVRLFDESFIESARATITNTTNDGHAPLR